MAIVYRGERLQTISYSTSHHFLTGSIEVGGKTSLAVSKISWYICSKNKFHLKKTEEQKSLNLINHAPHKRNRWRHQIEKSSHNSRRNHSSFIILWYIARTDCDYTSENVVSTKHCIKKMNNDFFADNVIITCGQRRARRDFYLAQLRYGTGKLWLYEIEDKLYFLLTRDRFPPWEFKL